VTEPLGHLEPDEELLREARELAKNKEFRLIRICLKAYEHWIRLDDRVQAHSSAEMLRRVVKQARNDTAE
jgi:hypothetical protein